MALSTDSIKQPEQDPKGRAAKGDTEQATANPGERRASGKYAPAGESSDPNVQQILGEKQIAVTNGDEDAVKDCDRRLNDLGYE